MTTLVEAKLTEFAGPKLTIVSGEKLAVESWFRSAASTATRRIELAIGPYLFPVPWLAIRQLFGELEKLQGVEPVGDAIAPHAVHLSTVFRRLRNDLSPEDESRRRDQAGAALGLLPMAGPVKVGRIADAVASSLTAILGPEPVSILVANAAELDCETWGVLLPLFQRHPALTLVVGQNREYEPADGIQNRVSVVGAWELSVLASVRHLTVHRVDLEGNGAAEQAPAPASPPSLRATFDDDLELRASHLVVQQTTLSDENIATVLEAVDVAFDAMGFASVLFLAKKLMERVPAFEGVENLRLLAGAAAYHVCTFAELAPADEPLFAFGNEQFELALPALTAVEHRVYIMYRRALWLANTGGIEKARTMLEEAVGLSDTLPSRFALHRAYSHMGLAYVWFRMGNTDKARIHCAAAIASVAGATNGAPEIEVGHAHFNGLVNLARLAHADGDNVEARSLLNQAHQRLDRIPYRKPFFSWFSTEVFLDDMQATVDDLESRYQQMLNHWSETITAPYAFWSGDLHYRLGNSAKAFDNFRTASELWSHFHHDPEEVFFARLNCAVAAYRDGQFLEARKRFEEAIQEVSSDEAGMHAELQCGLALIASHLSQSVAALEAIGKAKAALAAVEEPDVQARVYRTIGDTQLRMGKPTAAQQSFEQGLLLCNDASSSEEIPAEDILGLLLGLFDTQGPNDVLVAQAFSLASEALLDADAWWEMSRLLKLLRNSRWAAVAQSSCEFHRLLSTLGQRADCAAIIQSLSL